MANSPLLEIPLLSVSQSNKEQTINSMISYLERAMNDGKTLAFGGGNLTLPKLDLQRYFLFKVAGAAPSSVLTITGIKRLFAIDNLSNGSDLSLSCGTDTMPISANGMVVVYCDGTSLFNVCDSTVNGGGTAATSFTALTDTPNSYAAAPKYVLRVKDDLTGIEFVSFGMADLSNVDLTGIDNGFILKWDETTSKFVASDPLGLAIQSPYWKRAVKCATTAPIDFGVTTSVVIDGVTVNDNDSVLVNHQVDKTTNGIWLLTPGAWVRRDDADTHLELPKGASVVVQSGATNGLSTFYMATEITSIGTQDIQFSRYIPTVSLGDLTDVDMTIHPPADRQFLMWDAAMSGAHFEDLPEGVPDPTGQTGKILGVLTGDVLAWINPSASSYPDMTGKAGQPLCANATEDGVEWKPFPTIPNDISLGVFAAGSLLASEIILVHDVVIPFSIPSGYTDSKASSTDPSAGTAVFTVRQNGTSIGSITFSTANTGVFSGAGGTFALGDKLSIEAPGTPDGTLKNVSISLKGART